MAVIPKNNEIGKGANSTMLAGKAGNAGFVEGVERSDNQ